MKGKVHSMLRTSLIIFVIFMFLSSCRSHIEKAVNRSVSADNIRVKLTGIKKIVKIPLARHIVIEDVKTGNIIKFPWIIKSLRIEAKGESLLLNTKEYGANIKIYSKNNRIVMINKRKYFGLINITVYDSKLEIINTVPLETYLLSVVPSEVPISFHSEALKAQTIVARTYAYLFMKKFKDKREFDVDDTTRYQVYKGFDIRVGSKHIKKLEKAVKQTNGIIVIHNDEPITAYFHSNSGGIIRSGKEYFGVHSDLPYLISHKDPYSIGYSGDKWEYLMPQKNFLDLFDVSNDLSNDHFVYNKNGFIESVKLEDLLYTSKEVRRIVGYSKIKSERFRAELKTDTKEIYFNGIGYGHGVGMSQWGAQGMAEKGFDHNEIISFYYPNTEFIRLLNENRSL